MSSILLPTPFHARTAERNSANAWMAKGAFTVPAHYGNPCRETLASRLATALFDISGNEDLYVEGSGAAALLAAACGAPLYAMGPGQSESVHWCADGGGLRGFGVVSCLAKDEFLLRSADTDMGWFGAAAPRFGVSVREVTRERALLLLAGPFAVPLLISAGLDVSRLDPKRHMRCDWGDMSITVFRSARLGGYELSSAAEDATLMFDRLARAGRDFGLSLAGEQALQMVQMEAGLPIPHLDFTPAREPFARTPLPSSLGIGVLSPSVSGTGAAADAEKAGAAGVLAGIELESDKPMPFAPVFAGERAIGRSLRSAYSPALKSAIALAQLAPAHAAPGTVVVLRREQSAEAREIPGRVVALPFL